MNTDQKAVVIGGCGHIGLPLAILLAEKGRPTTIFDIDREAVALVASGKMPFRENEAPEKLCRVLDSGLLDLTTSPSCIEQADVLVLIIGTPIDEHLNPKIGVVFDALETCLPFMRDGQTLILRSTVYPGVSQKVRDYLLKQGLDIDVAFCPERVLQGNAFEEMQSLPQIISGFSERALRIARDLFEPIASKVVVVEPMEAELAKLFSNAYRYIQFAAVNQFYMIAEQNGASFERIHRAVKEDYPRLIDLPTAGFAAGPCLFKDTMQLVAFSQHHFSVGLSSVWVNEGLPGFLIEQLKAEYPLSTMTAGILGMTFKAESDDTRDSLSFKLRNLLQLETKETLCHDPYVEDFSSVPLSEVVDRCDLLIIGAPHRLYRHLEIPAHKILVDIWACRAVESNLEKKPSESS